MPAKRETVYQRFKRVGFITGPDHPIARAIPAKKAEPPKPKTDQKIDTSHSLENRRRLLETVLGHQTETKAKTSTGPPVAGIWVRDVTDDYVIFDRGGKIFASSYEVTGDDAKLGHPFEVREEKQYVVV